MDRTELLSTLREIAPAERIITALDVPGAADASALAERLGPLGRFVKVGLELFSAAGPDVVERLQTAGKEVFLDLKYHDIPNTVASAARVAAGLGVAMVTIHTASGRNALTAAAAALATAPVGSDGRRPALLGVTVLTSLDQAQLAETAPGPDSLPQRVARLARLAWECGCDGLVCSAADLPHLRDALGSEPLVVTPGIRPAGTGVDDQRRVTTPRDAMRAGADFLVIGRPITRSDDPGAVFKAIAHELDT